MKIERPRPGKAMVSQEVFRSLRASLPTARLEIHSIGRIPTRAEITAALTRAVSGNFTLSLEKSRNDAYYVSEIAPVDCLTWFEENCSSYKPQEGPADDSSIRAMVYWEDLKAGVSDEY